MLNSRDLEQRILRGIISPEHKKVADRWDTDEPDMTILVLRSLVVCAANNLIHNGESA